MTNHQNVSSEGLEEFRCILDYQIEVIVPDMLGPNGTLTSSAVLAALHHAEKVAEGKDARISLLCEGHVLRLKVMVRERMVPVLVTAEEKPDPLPFKPATISEDDVIERIRDAAYRKRKSGLASDVFDIPMNTRPMFRCRDCGELSVTDTDGFCLTCS